MKTVSKISVILIALLLSQMAAASDCTGSNFCSQRVITSLIVTPWQVSLKVDGTVANSCSYFGREFELEINDSNSEPDERKKAIYAALLSFVGQRKKIDIWFTPTEVGLRSTDETSGCTQDDIAKITNIAASFSTSEYPADELVEDEASGIPPAIME